MTQKDRIKILDIEEIRKIQVDILEKVGLFCEKKNIQYFIAAGTLIGSIRHKGFIPWDDDIDIIMSSDFYDIFIKEFNGYYKDIEVIDYSLNKDFPYPFAKICKKNTLLVEDKRLARICPLGINIDLFPFDKVKGEENAFIAIKKNYVLFKLLSYKNISLVKKRTFYKTAGIIVIQACLSIISRKYLICKILKNTKKYSTSQGDYDFLCNLRFPVANTVEIYKKKWFDKYCLVEFEGEYFRAPAGYDSFLRHRYGNYMELPPESERVTHHQFKAYKIVSNLEEK